MFHTSFIELSESAVKNNVQFIKNLLGKDVTFSAVVKGNAYGHGIENYCPLAHKHGVRHYSVFSADEALRVHQSLSDKTHTLLIMGYIENEELTWAIENSVHFYVFELDRLEATIQIAKKLQLKANIHIELETGMNRTGFDLKLLDDLLKLVNENLDCLSVEGICTHMAGAEDIINHDRVTSQFESFKVAQKTIQNLNWMKPNYHVASSAATIRYPEMQMDLTRIGILQYGFFPTQETLVHYLAKSDLNTNTLQRLITWKTRVMDIKTVKAGEYVGYGTSYFTNKLTRIAMIPVGYSFGYSRSLSNMGKVLIKGKRLNVIGNINMSMMAVDITNIEGIEKGEEVVLIGRQEENEISVSSFSDFSQLINYELLTRLPQDIPRIITQ
ncbi:MAG: alanine racemase [Bacteroidetes bacterium]|nr:alanine racemase [Bacteroidota bacterium]